MRQRGWPRRWRDALIEGLHASSSIGQRTKLAGCPGRGISHGGTQQPAIDGAPADGAVGPLVCQATSGCDARTGRSGGAADASCAAARPDDYSDAASARYSDATGQRDGDDAPRER